ncbi:MAG TPA: hypothetical protein VIX17_18950 [Pyrinomonadaceae bacterium]|jgi:uncharacterized protein YhfF
MKSVGNRIIIALLLVTMTGVAVFAKGKRTTVAFAVDTKVNGTLVKSGTYDVVFDEETSELSIVKGRKVVVKAAARLAMRDGKGRATEVHTVKEGDETAFVGISFGGSDQKVVLSQTGMQAGGNN